jgi:DNA gyrase subunit A
VVKLDEQVMLITAEGMVTRTPVKEKDPRKGITIQGRSTQGVKIMTLDEGDSLVAITTFEA